MPLLQFGDYRPDVADYEGSSTKNVLNVVPRGDGYGPFPGSSNYTAALPARCRGAFYALKSDGSVVVFAGTADRLYQLDNTSFTWRPVSRPAAVASISNASPAVVAFTNSFAANDPVVFSTSGALPAGLTAGTVYYVAASGLSSSAFSLSTTPGGGLINTSSAGTGTHSVTSTYLALSASAQWRFAQTGNLVFATQANAPMQVFDLASSIAFGDALGAPPQAAYIDVVGRFLVLSGLLSSPYRIQWSGLNSFNAAQSWTPGVNSSDFQDFPDGGIVRGVAGGEFGTVFQDQAIRRMTYVPGSPVVFQIDRIAQDKGLFAPYSLVRAGEFVFFYSSQGFQRIVPGGLPEQIGRERVDRVFRADLDRGNLQLLIGTTDPRSTKVYWAYKSSSGSAGLYDKVLGYDYVLDRFFLVGVSGEYLLGLSQSGLTLENLDTISSSIDTMTLTLDAYATAVQPEIAQFGADHTLSFFRGDNLEAIIETAEQGSDGQRIYLNGFRPITDAAIVFGSVSFRETQQGVPTYLSEVAMNARTGRCDLRQDTRYSRMRLRIPASTNWSFAAGVELDVTQTGQQ
jgi:hypothetical protein